MKKDFDYAFSHTMGMEGGYVNHKEDKGGETYKGVARNFHTMWEGWSIIDSLKSKPNFPKNLDNSVELQKCIKDFYKREFWDRAKCNEIVAISDKIAVKLFDMVVNCGVGGGSKILQRALNNCIQGRNIGTVTDDGKIGPITMNILKITCQKFEDSLYAAICGELYLHYKNICEKNNSQYAFFCGWMKRVC